ncbi:MAG TPA: GNAT family N-acetyltransferase [Bacteroidales bacterium]|nr:GNAT family N-acetyltransferase [Bacteroidales bacterium]HPB25057.1 GNAT family N-acetyltransferase [Bacteroidales bacterium]HPI31131.1 GNAT family N-acetyltransferase [Bacteroidales bacterium]HQN15375.1 GNAT family N-acetyltransferase [Bacteroidales bacterium]HQP15540.1 GNAT family N-acetyltransferase [Bacteroidales bacterium]
MENIIAPVSKSVLEKELSDKYFFRKTNFGNNHIYIVNAHNAPNVMQEIGRLREITFRDAGGGTGKSVDIDEYDICESPYEQMIVWNPADMEIVGGYRFIECAKALHTADGLPYIATTELFSFSERFLKEFLPHTIELGRSFVQPGYQPLVNSRKGMFSLENLWDGIGGLLIEMAHIKYFFGKVTMYPHFNQRARDIIMYFLFKYFPDKDNLVKPITPLEIKTDLKELEPIFNGGNYGADYKMLIQTLRELNENIPPLVKAYMNLTSTMRSFGTAINPGFGSVQETGILVTVEDIYENRKERHISSFRK